LKKISTKSLFTYFIEEDPGRGSVDIKKEFNVNSLDFFPCIFMDVMGGKITVNLKEEH
jgi:hypothetical protein